MPFDNNLIYFYQKIFKGLNGTNIITIYQDTNLSSRFINIGIKGYYFINNTEKFLIVVSGCIFLVIFLMIFGFCYENINVYRKKI